MNKIAILYGSSTGNTESVARKLNDLLEGNADLFNVDSVSIDEIKSYPYLILGTGTTGIGELQEDWDSFLPGFSKIDFSGKKVAIFALGDSASFSSSFAESMYVIYEAIHDKAEIVGKVADEDYTYDDSMAVIDGEWIGLPLDEDNEYDMTDKRLKSWAEKLRKSFDF